MPDICLKDIPGTVTTVFAEQQAKDEINRAAGDEVKSVSKNGYIYMGFAGDVSGKLGAVALIRGFHSAGSSFFVVQSRMTLPLMPLCMASKPFSKSV